MADTEDAVMINAQTLARWQQQELADLYDVRELQEFLQERIPGSVLVPLSRFDPSAITSAPDRKLVLHCKSGVRCGLAAHFLRINGFNGPIHRLEGGIIEWKVAGGAVEPGEL